MRYLLFLFPLLALAQAPNPPGAIRIVSDAPSLRPIGATIEVPVTLGTNNPYGLEHLGAAAWWWRPDTNVWTPEYSTNGVDWFRGNHTAFLPPRDDRVSNVFHFGWNFTETGTNWFGTNFWRVRIIRVK
jgi:hypothetical protein